MSAMKSKVKLTRQQFWIVVAGALFQSALCGVLHNTHSVLFEAIRHEYAFAASRVSDYNAVQNLCKAVISTFMTALFFRMSKKHYMSACIGIMILCHLLLIPGANTGLWYFSGLLNGAAMCTQAVMVPYVLSMYFRAGGAATVSGIALGSTGICGAIASPFAAWLIGRFGWRAAVLILCALVLCLAVPAIHILFKYPLPEAEEEKSSSSDKAPDGDASHPLGTIPVAFVLPLVIAVLFAGSCGYQFILMAGVYATDMGYSLAIGASFASAFMLANFLWKIIYGILDDCFGTWKAVLCIYALTALAILCLMHFSGNLMVIYPAMFCYGSIVCMSTVAISRICVSAYGRPLYKKYLGIHVAAIGVTSTLCALIIGRIHDHFGSFRPMFMLTLGVLALASVSIIILSRIGATPFGKVEKA